MAGTLYVVNHTDERIEFDPNTLSFTAVAALGDGYSTIVVKPKAKPTPPAPPPALVEAKGTLPPRPVDIDMCFIGGLPDHIEAHNLWPAGGATAPGIATIGGAITLDHLRTWARGIPEGQHQVLVLERPDGS